jgi:lipopolysaccharide/colanic/teichoic acid biosynthesis glycosyltransferase
MMTAPENVQRTTTVRPAGEPSLMAGAAFRTLDLVIALLLLVPLAPLVALVALAIHLESPGPAIVRSRRLGLDLEPFEMHVFRGEGHVRTGRLVGRLPQLLDVVLGRMSMVGPAPARPFDIPLYEAAPCTPHWWLRFAVKPGITGLAQLAAGPDRRVADMVALDVDYVCRRSLQLNLRILGRTSLTALDPRRKP